jgi:beta-galactosidase
MTELKRDMELLKRQGFNLIKLQEHWLIDEPRAGVYEFARYEELIEHAARLDLGVYLGLTCEQAPAWLYRKHPDCRMVGRNGLPVAYQAQTTLPADGKPGPCYDHPGALADQLRFITRLVETLGRYENLVIWNTWQEIGYWAEGTSGQHVCYCPHTLAHYRRWLQEEHGDLDALNRAWNSRYAEWEDIVPERCVPAQPWVQDIEFRRFMDTVQIPAVLRARAAAIRAADPLQRPVFAHKGAPLVGSGQDWVYARCQDFLGSSCYPAWSPFHAWDDEAVKPYTRHRALLNETWNGVALRFDYMRCANPRGRPLWAAEFQGGPVSTGFHKGRVPSAEDIQRWLFTAVGSGVSALSFWVARAEIAAAECNGFSLLDSTGDTTPRLDAAGRVGRALNRHPELFGRASLLPAAVAILVNERNHQFCNVFPPANGLLGYALRGWHRRCWDASIPLDFVDVSELDEAYAREYRAIIVPFPFSLSETVAAQLTAYVEAGGCLICEAAPGRINENAYCNRGEISPAMAALFGVRQRSFTLVREPDGAGRWSPEERTWGEYLDAALLTGTGPLAGLRLRANLYIQTFDLAADATACLLYGDAVAGVVRRHGRGQAWLLGTYPGFGGTAYRDPDSAACTLDILRRCGITSDAAGGLLRRRRRAGSSEAWILTNASPDVVAERLDVSGWGQVTDLLGESLQREGDLIGLEVAALDVRVLVLER